VPPAKPRRSSLDARRRPTSALEASLALQLWTLSDAFDRRLGAELAPMGLTVAGFRLVGELLRAPEGLRVGTLAERLRVTAPTVSGMVDRFEAQGLLERIADPDDARASRVRLAKDASLAEGIRVLERVDRCLLEGVSAAERVRISAQLARLTASLRGEPEKR
jgi:DNA-binding MarR family transcriptional regulator